MKNLYTEIPHDLVDVIRVITSVESINGKYLYTKYEVNLNTFDDDGHYIDNNRHELIVRTKLKKVN